MKILIAIMFFFLVGCASKPIINTQKTLIAPPEIMQECEEFLIPKDGSFEEMLRNIVENKKQYELCKNQNKAKKKFIIKSYQ